MEAQRREVTYPRPHSYERLRRDLNQVCLILESEFFTAAWGCLSVTPVGNGVRSLSWEGGKTGGFAVLNVSFVKLGHRRYNIGQLWHQVSTSVLLCSHLKKCSCLAQVLPTSQGCWDFPIPFWVSRWSAPLGPGGSNINT